jgi:hypothetical protein
LGRNFSIDSVSVIEEWTTLKGETPCAVGKGYGGRVILLPNDVTNYTTSGNNTFSVVANPNYPSQYVYTW